MTRPDELRPAAEPSTLDGDAAIVGDALAMLEAELSRWADEDRLAHLALDDVEAARQALERIVGRARGP